jgi:hypothetical protein
MRRTAQDPRNRQRQDVLLLSIVVTVALVWLSIQAPAQQSAVPAAQAAQSVISSELAETHPAIAQYHWSKLPNPTGKPKYGDTLHLDRRLDPSNWDPFAGNVGTYTWGNVVYNKLMQVDMTLSTAFETQGANLQQLFPVCDLCESWQQTSPTQYTFKGSVSKVEMVIPMALIYQVLFPSISTFETPPIRAYGQWPNTTETPPGQPSLTKVMQLVPVGHATTV